MRVSDLTRATADAPVILKIRGAVAAGSHFSGSIRSGECLEIMTGAPIPKGADAVVMKEDVQMQGKAACFRQPTVSGDNIRFRAEDIRRGEEVLSCGDRIGPAQIGLLAAQGYGRVLAIPKISVGIVVTGSELVKPGRRLGPGKIYDSNSFMLRALVRQARASDHVLGVARDERRALATMIRKALRYDVAIIAGGVSVGTFDYVKEIFGRLGVKEIFWKIKIKPGMPVFFGMRDKTLVFGVPGNPVSAFVVFDQFIVPAIRKAMGHLPWERETAGAILQKDISKKPGKTTYVRAICRKENGTLVVQSAGSQGSHSLKSLVRANALLILPEEAEKIRAGEKVAVQLLSHV